MIKPLKSVLRFYYEGFRDMRLGKTLWLIILIKLFIMFVILKVFFFHDFLDSRCATETDKAEYVGEQLIDHTKNP